MLGLGVEAAIRHSRHLGGARRTLKRAYVLEAEQSGTDATQRVRAAYVGPPFAVLTMPGAKLILAREGSARLATPDSIGLLNFCDC
jgi:hypothetical protein